MTPLSDGLGLLGSPLFSLEPEPRDVDDDRPCATCGHPAWMHSARCHHATWTDRHVSRQGEKQCGCAQFVRIG